MLSAERLRENLARVRDEIGPDPQIVVATKYVTVDELGVLAEAGVETVGENRLQDLEAKHERWGDSFQWHFIGHLQSRKAPRVSELVELVHSLDSLSSARRLSVPSLVEVNLSGEESKSGVPAEELGRFLADARNEGVEIRGLMTMPPLTGDPEDSRPFFAGCASWRPITASRSCPWGRRRTTASPLRKGRRS